MDQVSRNQANLILNLAQLQNQIRRDPCSYEADFAQQLSSFEAQLAIYEISPTKDSKEFGRLVLFLSHVSNLYPSRAKRFPEQIFTLMQRQNATMEPELRKSLFQSLVLLRNRKQLDPVALVGLCFELFRCQDKTLRSMVYQHVVSDVRNINKRATNLKLNRAMQNLVFDMLEDTSPQASKMSLKAMIELYKRRIWTDAKTVNVVASACFSKHEKIVVSGVHFFLGIDQQIDSLEEEEEEQKEEAKVAQMGEKGKIDSVLKKRNAMKHHSKRTRARVRKEQKEEKALKRVLTAKMNAVEQKRAVAPRFPAIELMNDPQAFVERLFKQLKASRDHFEVRLAMMNLISRVLGHHKLLLLPFFSFLQRYVQAHQRHVTGILAFVIQASHDLVPVEELQPIVKLIANNFVTDRSGSEVMAVGLNSIRELITRVPLLTSLEDIQDLIGDLVEYRRYRKDKSVIMAARSLLNLIRSINPTILSRKLRGKFHDNGAKPLEYGQEQVHEGIEGVELLRPASTENVEKSLDQQRPLTSEEFSKLKRIKQKMEQERLDPRARRKRKVEVINEPETKNWLVKAFRRDEGEDVMEEETVGLPEEEEANGQNAEVAVNEIEGYVSEFSDASSDDEDRVTNDVAVDPSSLEGVQKRKRRELADRLESVYKGRNGMMELQNKRSGGTNNAEKNKAKNYLMVRHSDRVKKKQSVSLRQQQYRLRKHIKTLSKRKKTVQKIRRRTKH